ncbi:MAG: tRNA (adenosine(37)-N6)-dimethylallyltransferase MiaA [Prevotella sp.]|nr:tRNA (adenosine(37)-N6)-dimethylallyltransferase MiaA [Bacteroidales bacterium]MCI6102718.1 tRNA (adenosine(37)-N6)-dimethylallyltransferase MiaA [Bacteroidales bacterium]MDY4705147.1 tRNA (adenosine(37)-N6)-dimethylallyltransferase MiaA [Prevotella sp.]MDY4956224.1 tRNA (adenosine(37)-N6)-dimethylallyltransferase MiaA [Prevotella sp.]MDY5320375.1 tRNA (adenosine(37)-N6)-dimethylallyltransferase MiaA [Prevotella sp.]
MTKPHQLITILGPTASGKTALAARLAYELDGEIISGDSRQVYRGMTIGTGKDLDDYIVDGHAIPYHLIDICEPGEKYNIFQYQQDFLRAWRGVQSRGKWPILCGGSGLYIESVLRGYALSPVEQNPELRRRLEGKSLDELTRILLNLKAETGSTMHNTTDVDTPQRAIRAIEIETFNAEHPTRLRQMEAPDSLVVGVAIDRDERRRKITARLRRRLDEGMVDEIRGLLAKGIKAEDLIYYGLEYKYVTLYAIGQLSYEEMFRQLEIAIHQFAKRQMTWFRGMERRGCRIHWIDAASSMEDKLQQIRTMINNG